MSAIAKVRKDGAKRNKPQEHIESLRIKPSQAAKIIGAIGYAGVLDLVHRDVFTVFDNGKRGVLRRISLLREEVKIYAEHGEDALREHRAKKKRSARR